MTAPFPQIEFDMQEQLGDFWCWLAVAVSMDRHFRTGSRRKQCGLASVLIDGASACCGGARPSSACDQPGALEEALEEVGQNETTNPVASPMSFPDLQRAIDSGKPVCAFIDWNDGLGAGHFIAITGHKVNTRGTKYVYVKDSLYGDGTYTYNSVLSNYYSAGGRWTHHYTVRG